jgi:hypothetical protein
VRRLVARRRAALSRPRPATCWHAATSRVRESVACATLRAATCPSCVLGQTVREAAGPPAPHTSDSSPSSVMSRTHNWSAARDARLCAASTDLPPRSVRATRSPHGAAPTRCLCSLKRPALPGGPFRMPGRHDPGTHGADVHPSSDSSAQALLQGPSGHVARMPGGTNGHTSSAAMRHSFPTRAAGSSPRSISVRTV